GRGRAGAGGGAAGRAARGDDRGRGDGRAGRGRSRRDHRRFAGERRAARVGSAGEHRRGAGVAAAQRLPHAQGWYGHERDGAVAPVRAVLDAIPAVALLELTAVPAEGAGYVGFLVEELPGGGRGWSALLDEAPRREVRLVIRGRRLVEDDPDELRVGIDYV